MALNQDQRYYLKLKALSCLYEDGLTQTETAKKLHISRVTLSRLLSEAREEGMIKIEIVDVRGKMEIIKLEKEMCDTFGLREIRLVDAGDAEGTALTGRIAAEAALYTQQLIRSGMKIGLTWGRTLNSMIRELQPDPGISGLSVYTLVGGSSSSSSFQPNVLAQQLIDKFDGQAIVLTAPFMCRRASLCAEIKMEPSIAEILNTSKDVDITLVGIGEEPEKGADHLSDYPFDKRMINELVKAHAAGDICGNFFDIHGQLCDTPLRDRIISIDITDLPSHKWVVGIGGGQKKVRSLIGALSGGYLDVLVTDVKTARSVLTHFKDQ